MAEFLVKMANERGHLLQQLEHGYSESEVRDRFVQQGFLVYWVKPCGMFVGGQFSFIGSRRLKLSSFLIYNQQFLTIIKVVTCMVVFLVTYVVPKFADLFMNLNAKLPAITVFMLAVGLNAQKYGPVALVVLIVLALVLWRWKKTDRGAERVDRAIFSV